MKNRKRLLKTVGLLTAATVMTVSFNAESVLACDAIITGWR